MRGYGIVAAVTAAALCVGWASDAALAQDDGYIRGYASAVAEREYGVAPGDVDVRDGVVRVNAPGLTPDQRARLADALRTVRGVTDVRVAGTDAAPAADAPAVASAPSSAPAGVSSESAPAVAGPAVTRSAARDAQGVEVAAIGERYQLGLLPGKTLFDPLIADPQWPHIAGTYRAYQGSNKFADTGAADFGGSLAIYRFEGPGEGALSEVGLQAGVFSTFDLDAESHDLVNADYFVALTDTYRLGRFSVIGRVLHQSSHLGDEYLLAHLDEPGFQRVNFSYEAVDAIASYDLTRSWRVYGGGAFRFDTDPVDLGNWSLHYGVQYTAPFTIGDHLRPVAAADVKHKEYEDWDLDLSVRAGVQIEGAEMRGNRLMLLLEYYTGRDPNGQFYTDSVQWYGVGLHWFF
jgi:hypothetical protein